MRIDKISIEGYRKFIVCLVYFKASPLYYSHSSNRNYKTFLFHKSPKKALIHQGFFVALC